MVNGNAPPVWKKNEGQKLLIVHKLCQWYSRPEGGGGGGGVGGLRYENDGDAPAPFKRKSKNL